MVGRLSLAALAALLAVGSPASPLSAATVITQTVTIPATTATRVAPGGTALISFNPFDQTLGTLLGVTLSFAATSETDFTVRNNSQQNRDWQVTPRSTVTLSGNGFTLADAEVGPVQTFTLAPRFGPGNPRTQTITFDTSYSDEESLAAGFAPFIGNGPVQFTFSALNRWITSGSGPTSWDLDRYTGSATLAYSYEAPAIAVPEPAAWGLMLAGFAMIGVAARRRKTGAPVTLG